MPETIPRREATPVADTRGSLAKGNPWNHVAQAIRSLPRSMFAGARLRSRARAVVAQAAYAMVLDRYATARAKEMAVTTLVRMLRSFEQNRRRPAGRSSRAPLAEPNGSGMLDRVPLDVLLASFPIAPQFAKRGGDAIKKAGPR